MKATDPIPCYRSLYVHAYTYTSLYLTYSDRDDKQTG